MSEEKDKTGYLEWLFGDRYFQNRRYFSKKALGEIIIFIIVAFLLGTWTLSYNSDLNDQQLIEKAKAVLASGNSETGDDICKFTFDGIDAARNHLAHVSSEGQKMPAYQEVANEIKEQEIGKLVAAIAQTPEGSGEITLLLARDSLAEIPTNSRYYSYVAKYLLEINDLLEKEKNLAEERKLATSQISELKTSAKYQYSATPIPGIMSGDIKVNMESAWGMRFQMQATSDGGVMYTGQVGKLICVMHGLDPFRITAVIFTVDGPADRSLVIKYLGYGATIPYNGSQPSQARAWVTENLGQRAETTIGLVRFTLFGNDSFWNLKITSI